MELKVMMLIVALVPLGVVAANRDHNQALDGCRRECGGVQIPYPFGIGKSKTTGENCSMDEPFELTCEEQDSILKSGDFQVTSINITKGQVEMMAPVSKSCRDTSSDETTYLVTFPSFTVSRNDNKFVSVGCDTFGYLNSSYDGGRTYSTGCLSRCYGNMFDIVDESCSGFGCCQMDIPPNMVNISIQAASFDNFEESLSFNNCSYSFVVKNGNYTFYKKDLKKLRFDDVAVIYDWSGGAGFIALFAISTRGESSQTVQLFTEDELKKATKNYDDKLIIGRGGYGTVFKGVLTNNRIVAIKKSKIVDESQIEQFINEVVVLSRINHRNVVKLLGCCLETEVPLLVYEFINNGTLFNFMHKGRNANNLVWETRLRIATEAAGALSYLHSAASIPIIHRDIKSANILLDSTYTAKVSDFGASRFVPQDQIALATMVQGTIGYLDPEYMQTSQLTEKSDVYSFGVVLAELLTGEEPLSFDRSEEKRSLAIYFLSCLKANRLSDAIQDGILNEKNEQEIKEVAILAAKCLSLKGEDRPSMKEVAMELEGIRVLQKHPWSNNNGDNNLAETQCLVLDESSSRIHMHSERCSHQNYRYDSINDQLSSSLDGR
ncbi:hypothetical protein AHAS_Ahas06G0229800 [Arachis hypogaea]